MTLKREIEIGRRVMEVSVELTFILGTFFKECSKISSINVNFDV